MAEIGFGIALTPSPGSWKTVRRAEELGFQRAWFYDSQLLYTDVFIAMALAAEHSSRIRLGTGVLIPTNRIAPMAANCFASLNQIAPGRIDFGVGTGFTGRNTMGLPAQRLDDMAEYATVVRALLKGEIATFATEGTTSKVRFLNPENGMLNVEDPVGYHVSAFGPRGRELTAKTADGWITFMGPVQAALHQAKEVDEACRAAGRDPASLARTVFTLGCVLAEGEAVDSARSLAQAGPAAAVSFHGAIENFSRLPAAAQGAFAGYRKLYESYQPADARYLDLHRGHLLFVREDERGFITRDQLAAMPFVATPPQIRENIQRLEAAGYAELSVQLVYGHEAEALEEWAAAFGLV